MSKQMFGCLICPGGCIAWFSQTTISCIDFKVSFKSLVYKDTWHLQWEAIPSAIITKSVSHFFAFLIYRFCQEPFLIITTWSWLRSFWTDVAFLHKMCVCVCVRRKKETWKCVSIIWKILQGVKCRALLFCINFWEYVIRGAHFTLDRRNVGPLSAPSYHVHIWHFDPVGSGLQVQWSETPSTLRCLCLASSVDLQFICSPSGHSAPPADV